jgi:uncharacterized protein YqhQ
LCGCLITVSTFAVEIDNIANMPSSTSFSSETASYKHAMISNLAVQLILLFVYDIALFVQVPLPQHTMVLCETNQDLCQEILERIGCLTAYQMNTACEATSSSSSSSSSSMNAIYG